MQFPVMMVRDDDYCQVGEHDRAREVNSSNGNNYQGELWRGWRDS